MLFTEIEYSHVNQFIETNIPVKNNRLKVPNDFDIFLNSGHLPKYVVVMTKSNVVHIVRCMVNSTGDANETNLK
jgi:hypothetical protein